MGVELNWELDSELLVPTLRCGILGVQHGDSLSGSRRVNRMGARECKISYGPRNLWDSFLEG